MDVDIDKAWSHIMAREVFDARGIASGAARVNARDERSHQANICLPQFGSGRINDRAIHQQRVKGRLPLCSPDRSRAGIIEI